MFCEAIIMSLIDWQQKMLNLVQGQTINNSAFKSKDEYLSARLQAYSNNYQGGLTAFLKITYPQVYSHLGEHNFNFICRDYIAENPMIKSEIDEYGHTFPQFLAHQISVRTQMQELAFLPDIAKVDWAVQSSYYNEMRSTFDFDSFAKLNIEQQHDVNFSLAPDIIVVGSHWPLEKLWQSHNESQILEDIEYTHDIHWVIIERPDLAVSVKSISPLYEKYVSSIKQGATLAELVELEQDLLSQFISSGWITGFNL